MAQWYNPDTGEWEEKPDTGTNAFSTAGATAVGAGLPTGANGQYVNPTTYAHQQEIDALSNADALAQFKSNYKGVLNTDGGPGEAARYNEAGFTDPWLAKESYAYNKGYNDIVPDWLEKAWGSKDASLDPVGTLGQRIARQGDMPSFTSSESALSGAYGSLGAGDTGSLAWAPKYLGVNADPSMTAWMRNNTASAQAARNNSGGLFGLGDMGIPLALAAMYFTGPAGAGLWGGEAAALGAGELAAADMAGGLLPEFGGLSSYSAGIGELGSMADLSGGLLPDFNISNLIGDPSYWPSSLGEAGNTLSNLPTSFEVPSSVTNMEQGFRELSQLNNPSGWNTSPLNPEASALENTSSSALDSVIEPKQYIDDYGVGTNSTGDMVNAKGQRAWQDVLSEKLRPSLGIEAAGSTVNNMSNIWNKLTTPLGGNKMNTGGLANLFKAPTPLELGVRGFGAWDSWNQGKKAQSLLEQQLSRSGASADSNAARGMTANDLWTKTQTDPMFGYDSFMAGAGRDFVNNARAAAAKGGNRGGYLNTGRMQSDLASLWQKNQTQRAASIAGGFANSPYASMDSITPAYANLVKNQNAPIFQGIQGAMDGFKLADLFS